MKEEFKQLRGLLSQLKREDALRERIKFLEREVARAPTEIVVEPDESHLDKLRARIKELEEKNHQLELRYKKIVDELG